MMDDGCGARRKTELTFLLRFGLDWSGLVGFGQGAPLLKLSRADKVGAKVGRQSAGDCVGIPTPPFPDRHSVTKPAIIDRFRCFRVSQSRPKGVTGRHSLVDGG